MLVGPTDESIQTPLDRKCQLFLSFTTDASATTNLPFVLNSLIEMVSFLSGSVAPRRVCHFK